MAKVQAPFLAEPLTADQQALLDLVADLALRGHDARPLHCAHALEWTEERTRAVFAELVELGLIFKNPIGRETS